MKKMYSGITAIILTGLMIVSILGACKKEDEVTQTSSGVNQTNTATAKTTIKSTVSASKTIVASTGNISSTAASVNVVSEDKSQSSDIISGEVESDESEETASENAGTDAAEMTFDLKGRQIKLMIWKADQEPLPDAVAKMDQVRYELIKEAEKKFNCTFKFEILGTNSTMIKAKVEENFMAGVYFADAFRGTFQTVLPAWEKLNIILPINDFVDLDDSIWKILHNGYGILHPENLYSINVGGNVFPYTVFYNNDVLGREGIPTLYDYLDQRKWNWETFLDIAMRTTKDINGDGITDQWGLGHSSPLQFGMAALYSNKGKVIEYSKATNEYKYCLPSEYSLKAIQFVNDLYNTYKVVDHTLVGLPNFQSGKTAMYVFEYWNGGTLNKSGMTNIECIYFPFGPDNPEQQHVVYSGGQHSFFFPSNLADPEAVVKAVFYWENVWDEDRNFHITDEETFSTLAEKNMFTQRSKDFVIKSYLVDSLNTAFDYVNHFSPTSSNINKYIFNVMVKDNTVLSYSAVDSIRDIVQDTINSYMK